MTNKIYTIPARRGKATRIDKGQQIKVINTHGQQVIDTWAFNTEDLTEFMSMEHTRTSVMKLVPVVGDVYVTNRRRPILTVVEDTSPGVHDTLLAACDEYRYRLLGCKGYHDNCTDNLRDALAELGLKNPETPSPLNLFMNIPWTDTGELSFEEPVSKPGDFITFRAEMDTVVVFSSCPQDQVPISGRDKQPKDAHFVKENGDV